MHFNKIRQRYSGWLIVSRIVTCCYQRLSCHVETISPAESMASSMRLEQVPDHSKSGKAVPATLSSTASRSPNESNILPSTDMISPVVMGTYDASPKDQVRYYLQLCSRVGTDELWRETDHRRISLSLIMYRNVLRYSSVVPATLYICHEGLSKERDRNVDQDLK